ncbi:hypothetical protein DL762_006049 [Monosporascus cannonballus]|uniref:Telomerase reverse transcriptase n=1 Tax=Monosporascus cannonballus TaxID=155416 RepID=A0ABY0H357_9PEZI|nr:hypothetical protein DL762_006049 [Monosporascus cannonballus]
MARPRKRKRAGSASRSSSDGLQGKKVKTHSSEPKLSAVTGIQHALLEQFYPHVRNLRDYILSRLPPSSRLRRKKVAAIGKVGESPNSALSDVEQSVGALLDSTLIGISAKLSCGSTDDRWEQWTTFSQKGDESYVTLSDGIAGSRFSQSEIVDFAIWLLFSKTKASDTWPKHLLCDGFRRNRGSVPPRQARNGEPNIPGLFALHPNPHVDMLKGAPWPQLLLLLGQSGERIMLDLLLDCAIFVPVNAGTNNYFQISGKPLSETELLDPDKTQGSTSESSVKSPSDIVFVRNRMLYARAALNARGLVHFGLRHIHVLNRSPYRHSDEYEACSTADENITVNRNRFNTMRVMMYMFPRQFGLHNVFTSRVDFKETSQRLKDYTLREDEIATKFGQPHDPGLRIHLPKRLRGKAAQLVKKFQILHQRCSYSELLHHICPVGAPGDRRRDVVTKGSVPRKAPRKTGGHQANILEPWKSSNALSRGPDRPLTDLATPPAKVSAFCQAVLSRILPNEFFGAGSTGQQNKELVLKKMHQFILLRRFEGMSLHEVMQGMKVTDIDWLAPRRLMSNKTSQTDMQKRVELFYEFLYFIFDSLLIPLIRSNFYVTESNHQKYRLFFFRHDVWRYVAEPSMSSLKLRMFEEVSMDDACRILDSRPLGFSQVRLLPKGTTMRPIMNLRRRTFPRGNKKALGLAINKLLAPAQAVLQLEAILRSAMFSVGDIYRRIKPFKEKIASRPQKLYFAKLDVQSAFDTIPQAAIVGLLGSIPQARRYRIFKYLQVAPNLWSRPNREPESKLKLTKKWTLAATRTHDALTLTDILESGRAANRRNTVFVDSFSKRDYETSELLQLVASHIEQNLVKIGKKFYRQKEGIPQGSVLSSTLCNYFYADLEAHVLPFLDSEDCLLLRLIDDFLLITTDKRKAVRFVETMHRGVPEYGVVVNPRKTLVNFELMLDQQPVPSLAPDQSFPYCGTKIDCETLGIARARDQEKGSTIYDSLTVEFSRTPGQNFQRKVLNAFKIQSHLMFFDTTLNSATTMLRNAYDAFMETATKAWAYARCLPQQKQPPASLVTRTISKLADVAYLLLVSKTRKRRHPGYSCDIRKCEVSWVLSQKQSRYGDVIGWLRGEIRKLGLLKDICYGRVRHLDFIRP